MFPFQTFAIKFFQEAHGTSREVGGNLSSILTLAAMIFTPLFGLLADKIGKRSLLNDVRITINNSGLFNDGLSI